MTTTPTKKISELNGAWSILLRIMLASYVPVLGLIAWQTSNQIKDNMFRNKGDRYTQGDANILVERLREHETSAWHQGMDIRVSAIERQMVSSDLRLEIVSEKLDLLLVAVTELKTKIEEGGK